MNTNLLLASIIILLFFFISFLIIKKFFIPLFFKPGLKKNEVKNYLEKKDLKFLDSRLLTKEEKKEYGNRKSDETFLERIYSIKSYYIITALSVQNNQIQLFRLEIKNWLITYPKWAYELIIRKKIKSKREIYFEEIKNPKKIFEAEKALQGNVEIKDKCPACNNPIAANEKNCSECGLVLNIIQI